MRILFASTLAALCLPSAAWAQAGTEVHFPVSCAAEVQEEFDQAVALLHHMTYPRAQEGFEKVAEMDPGCAMAHWGIAMTLFQPLWPTRPSPEDLRRGWDAVETANAMGVATEREQLFLATTAGFFQDPESTDYWARIRRWESAMENVYTLLPDDIEAAAFFSLAHLATANDVKGTAHQERVAGILDGVLEQNPAHPGGMHYTIHANDVGGRQAESPEVVRGYNKIAPRNPHALHMPTHIYVRLGEWEEVVSGNIDASEVALTHGAGPGGNFVWDEFAHSVGYLVYAHLQRGADDAALDEVRRLRSIGTLQPSFKTAFHLSTTRARLALETKAWSTAAAFSPEDPSYVEWEKYTWPRAVTWFAKGMGAVHTDRMDEAKIALQRVEQLREMAEERGETPFAVEIKILRLGLSSWIAQYEGRPADAVAEMEELTRLEFATPKQPVTPAPILPAFEQLGDLYMEQQRYPDALAAYDMSLEIAPHRFLSLGGAARAAVAVGDAALARTYYNELLAVADPESKRAALVEARAHTRGGSPQNGAHE